MAAARRISHAAAWRRSAGLLLVAAVSLAQTACVQRRLTIRSNPPGALVYVDNHEIGLTPVSTDFIYYGTREVRLVKDGFETLTILQPIPTPWYEYFPLDFVSENVVPAEIRDERTIEFTLVPQTIAHGDQLLQRAEDLRRQTRGQIVPPSLGPSMPLMQPAPGGLGTPLLQQGPPIQQGPLLPPPGPAIPSTPPLLAPPIQPLPPSRPLENAL